MNDLTLEEQKNVRIALRLLRRRVGGWEPVAKVLRFQANTLEKATNGRSGVTPTMALRVARFVGMSVDDLLAGKYAPPGTCPHCGHPPDFNDETTIAE